MKIRTLITTAVLSVVLGTGTFQVNADQQRTFGFTGEVNSFNRSAGTQKTWRQGHAVGYCTRDQNRLLPCYQPRFNGERDLGAARQLEGGTRLRARARQLKRNDEQDSRHDRQKTRRIHPH
jgi:hypothetical protein